MEFTSPNSGVVCRPEEIGRYLDGELSANHELEFEMHISGCDSCRDELNLQKNLVRALDDNFDLSGAPELPENFAQRISVAAVSDIGGIRSSRERWTAIAICCFLATFAIAALGGAAGQPLDAASVVADRSLAVLSAVGYFLYNLAVGIVAFIRPISGSLNVTVWALAVVGIAAFAALVYHRRSNSSN
jgi:anti-sigma factor RsiW